MKRLRFIALAACAALTAAAKPPRIVHLDIATAQSQDILVQCIEHKLSGLNVKEVPIDGVKITRTLCLLQESDRAPLWHVEQFVHIVFIAR